VTAVQELPRDELRRRIAADGMHLPNGRAEPADAPTWLRVLAALDAAGWPVRWDGSSPPTSGSALAEDAVGTGAVALAPGSDLRLYPSWGLDAVWFDVDVRTLTGAATERLGAFMRLLGSCTGSPVVLSREGDDAALVVGWFPADEAFRWLE
jgi:hypothetical protein